MAGPIERKTKNALLVNNPYLSMEHDGQIFCFLKNPPPPQHPSDMALLVAGIFEM